MALNLEDIAGHPALHRFVQEQSLALIRIYEESPRLASIFATQQRWLMAHVGLAMTVQAAKLTVVDSAFEACFPPSPAGG